MPGKSLVPWWLLLALCVLAGAGPAVAAVPTDPGTLAGLSGSVDYRLPAAAAAEAGAGGAWRVEKLEFTVDFDADPARTDLVEFAVRRQADDFEVIFTGADQSPVQEVDLETNFLSIRALTLMPGGGLAFVEITGRFTGPAAESFEADFTLNLDMATTVVRPVDPLTLTAGGVTEDPFAAYRVQRNAGEPEAAVREGRSIHAGTGNLFRAERDVPPAGPGGLAFTRYYNSRSPLAGEAGWLHTYAAFIDFAVEGVERGVLMIRPDGEALLFYRTDSGALAERPDEIPADVPAVPTARYPLAPVAGGEGWRFRNDRGGVEYYDDSGRLLRIVDRNGFTRTVERDAAGLITSVTGAFGRSLVFEHDVNRRLVAVTDPAGNRVTYAHDAEGRLVGVTRQDGASRRYHYGESGAPGNSLTGITDERGIRFAIWRYDTENRVVSGERAGGADRVELAWLDGGGTRVTTAGGAERTYGFVRIAGRRLAADVSGDLCDDCGKSAAIEYDALGVPVRETDARGTVTTRTRNAAGLETRRTEAAGSPAARTIRTEWDVERRLPLAIESAALRTEYGYDERGRLVTTARIDTATGATRTTTRRYQPDGAVPGRLAAIDGPRTDVEDVTRFAYDGRGNRVRVTNALGHVTEITDHDAFGRALRSVDPNGLVTERTFDARGRLTARVVGGERTTFRHDAAGNRVRVTRPDGSLHLREYDDAGRLVAVADADGNRIEYDLDAAGNRVGERVLDGYGAVARTLTREFDALGRVTRVIGAAGQATVHEYDANGNRVATISPDMDRTTRRFDALDRLLEVTDPRGGITRRQYDTAGRLVAVADPRGTTVRHEYNAFGERTLLDSPDAGVTRIDYDAAGNPAARTDAEGRRAEFVHDALNRRIRAEYNGGEIIVERTHDAGANGIGRLSAVEQRGPDGWRSVIEWSRDPRGRVIERREYARGGPLVTRHAYDDRGRRIETVHPSGTTVARDWDRDSVIGVRVNGETVVNGVKRRPFGPVSGWTWGDGDPHERQFDADGRLTGQTLGDGRRRIEYFSDDTVARIAGPRLDRQYEYDGLDRLVGARDAERLDRYAYDGAGNRVSRRVGDREETYGIADDSNRLLSVAGARNAAFTYDGTGNLVEDGEHRYGYSARNRLVSVDDGKTAVYRYNALGQRTLKVARQDVDFLALAKAAEARAEALSAQARELRAQAQAARAEANAARERAAAARADRARAWARLEQAEAEARWQRRIGGYWQAVADRFAERAERYRSRIADPPRSWWDYLRNRILKRLAAIFEHLAERFQAWADARFALAEAADERAARAQLDVARAEARIADAEAATAAADGRAEALFARAAERDREASEQRRRAAEFRRLAEEGAIRKTASRFVHDEAGRLIARHARGGTPLRDYVRLDGIPVAVVANEQLHYLHADHRDTPRLVSRPGGPVIWSWIGGPFGDGEPAEDADGDTRAFTLNLRFPGQYFDAETGRHLAGTRAYDPRLGRFAAAGVTDEATGNPWPYRDSDPVGRQAHAAPGAR